MNGKWTVEELERAVEMGRRFGSELLVGDSLDVLGEAGEVATVYFHFEDAGEDGDQASYNFTFDNTRSLDENFDGLWESVELFRGMSQRPGATAAMR